MQIRRWSSSLQFRCSWIRLVYVCMQHTQVFVCRYPPPLTLWIYTDLPYAWKRILHTTSAGDKCSNPAHTRRRCNKFKSSPQKDIRYLQHFQCVSTYGLCLRYLSLFIAYDRRNTVFQMALSQKFKDAVSGATVNVTVLYMGTRYLVLHCERVDTTYGDSVRLTLREDAEENIIRVFLPCHYGETITDEDMASINNHKIQYYPS